MVELSPTPRTRLHRLPTRGVYGRRVMEEILDEALVCHLGFIHQGGPVVVPTLHARVGRLIYVHGSAASRMLRTLADGCDVCLTVTLVDGVVLARSAFHHSLNYRSVVVFDRARRVTEPAEKVAALEALAEHVVPGRWADVRPPSIRELKATTVLALPLEEASAKVRSGPPIDDDEDVALPVWAGVVPLGLVADQPETDVRVPAGIAVPAYALSYVRLRRNASERWISV